MFSTVFNPCSNTFSGFLLDWNERGWIVIHQGNLTSDYQIFFVFNSMYSIVKMVRSRSVEHYSDVYNGRWPNVKNICTISLNCFFQRDRGV